MSIGIITERANNNPLCKEFTEILGGFNFVTPVIVDYVQKDKYICEISRERYVADHLVGVTVIDAVNKKRCVDKDMSFIGKTLNESMCKAYSYIENL